MKNVQHIFISFFLLFIFSLQSMENFKKLGEKIDPHLDMKNLLKEVLFSFGMDFSVFELSYKGQGVRIDGKNVGAGLISTIPTLGFYDRQGYAYRKICLLVQFDLMAKWNFLPLPIQNELIPVRQIKNSSIRGAIVLNTNLSSTDSVALKSHLVNIVYHAWAGEILNKDRDYNIQLPMGIFEADGVEPYRLSAFDLPRDYAKKIRGGAPLPETAGIAFNKLAALTVHEHHAYSPDNALFVISPGRDLTTFWSVAIYENKHALVTFHILANNTNLADLLCKQIANSNTLKDILTGLYNTALPKISNLADKNALRNAIVVIRDLIGATYPSASKEPSLYQSKNPLLIQNLQNLKKALYQLQKILMQS